MTNRRLRIPTRHGWLRHFIHRFESDPDLQYAIHMTFTYFWLVNLLAATLVFVFFRPFWDKVSIFYVVIVSLYANFATDYGAVSAAEAAQQPRPQHVEGTATVGDAEPQTIAADVTITPEPEEIR